jgi:choline dehydrogenase-like flavoprotein
MVYIRGLPSDFDGWAAKGYTGWGFQDVLPYLRKSERNQPGRMQGEVSRSRSIAANLA